MNPCAQALLEGIIDYAGLFPPAAHPMEEAFSRYLAHRRSEDGWMLARFVCPAARLDELEFLLTDDAVQAAKIDVAVLGRGGATLDEFVKATDEDAALIRAFLSRQQGRATADVFEVRLPEAGGAAVAVEKAWRSLTENGATEMTPYFEVSLLGEWRPRLPAAAAAIRDATRTAGGDHRLGLKIRCGGLDPAAIPEPMAVAASIATCRATGVPLKATQGLHHPFRHTDEALGADVHGFLNLFTAGGHGPHPRPAGQKAHRDHRRHRHRVVCRRGRPVGVARSRGLGRRGGRGPVRRADDFRQLQLFRAARRSPCARPSSTSSKEPVQ